MTDWLEGSEKSSSHSPLVLCVALEADILNLIRRFCTNLPCRIHTTDSAEEALAFLGASKVNLVMADQRLKTMTGSQFLKEVAQRSPATARVLLASYPENHDILQTEEERIHGIIGKPWDGPSLQRTLQAILRWQQERQKLSADTDSLPLSRLAGPAPGAPRRVARRSARTEAPSGAPPAERKKPI